MELSRGRPRLSCSMLSPETGVPLVEVTDRHRDSKLPLVRSDDAAIGRMGAEHLLERGFQRFGFCGFRGKPGPSVDKKPSSRRSSPRQGRDAPVLIHRGMVPGLVAGRQNNNRLSPG